MTLRKINAWLSLLTTAMILDHAVFYSVWMLTRGRIAKSGKEAPLLLTALVLLHAILSMVIVFRDRRNGAGKGRVYGRLNAATVVQRLSAGVMLLLLAMHIIASYTFYQPVLLHALLHPLFFAAVLAHTAVSLSKALVMLGLGSAKFIRWLDIGMALLCGLVFVAAVAGLYLCLFVGVAL